VTCHEARELFSSRADDALTPAERGELEGHLAGCAECRRELARFEATLALLHGAPPARAPVGFVDRVLAAARPAPWYARLGRRLVQPLAWRRPLEATVVVLVGVTAVYLYQRTPELQQVAPPAPSYPVATQAAPPPAPSPVGSEPMARAKTAPPASRPGPEPRPEPKLEKKQEQEKERYEADAFKRDAARTLESRAQTPAGNEGAAAGRLADAPPAAFPATPAPAAGPAPPAAAQAPAAPPAAAPAEKQAAARSETGGQREAPRPFGRAGAAGVAVAVPDLSGRLAVDDRSAAEAALRDLLARVGATEVARRRDGAALVIEVMLPGAAYGELAAGLARIGRWQPDRVPPELTGQIRVTLRLTD
jgi:hypothetical protein